ncbi:MAG: prephenate dehydrogenase/arogenate dehydrogenase family protein [Bifidobacteriaceae bacterium]|nr:prephenate dehydrogenase/arogenate dehydrogenase family protein [Bifidobacteriaceae bacterium]
MTRIIGRAGHASTGVDLAGAEVLADATQPSGELMGLVREAGIVGVALPEPATSTAIAWLLDAAPAGAILISTASVQGPAHRLARSREERCALVGVDPMFAPSLATAGRTVLLIADGPRDRAAARTIRAWLQAEGAVTRRLSPDQHDRAIGLLQTLPHAAILATARVIAESGLDPSVLADIAPPPARLMLAMAARMLAARPHVYHDIQATAHAESVRGELARALARLGVAAAAGPDGFAAAQAQLARLLDPILADSAGQAARAYGLFGDPGAAPSGSRTDAEPV